MSKMVVPAPRYESVMDLIEESGMRSVAGLKRVADRFDVIGEVSVNICENVAKELWLASEN